VKAALLAVSLLGAGVSIAQPNSASQSNAPLGARLKMRWQGSTVILSEGAASHRLELRDRFHAVNLEKVILQSAKESGDFIYLLLDVAGPSKLPRDSHQCGGGSESDLIWFKLDKSWKVQDAKAFRYESCWSDISADDPPKWQGDTLKVSVFSAAGGKSVAQVATYTYKSPDAGIKVVETPMEK
jgi:hypothetical protein